MHENVASPQADATRAVRSTRCSDALTAARSSASPAKRLLEGPSWVSPGNYSMAAVWIACRGLCDLLRRRASSSTSAKGWARRGDDLEAPRRGRPSLGRDPGHYWVNSQAEPTLSTQTRTDEREGGDFPRTGEACGGWDPQKPGRLRCPAHRCAVVVRLEVCELRRDALGRSDCYGSRLRSCGSS